MLSDPLQPKLRRLLLSGMLLTLETRAAQAVENNLTPLEFLALLLDDELERRTQHRLKRVLLESGVDAAKALSRFDFSAVPQLNRGQVLELASGSFIATGDNVLLCGPAGVGKSQICNALAYEALKRGQSVIFRSAHRLLADLHAARADGSYPRAFANSALSTSWPSTTLACCRYRPRPPRTCTRSSVSATNGAQSSSPRTEHSMNGGRLRRRRSWPACSALASLLRTCHQQARDPTSILIELLRSASPVVAPLRYPLLPAAA